MTNKYIIWGSSGHALVLNEILRSQGYDVVALFDNDSNALSVIDNAAIHYGESGFYDWLRIQENIGSILSVIAIGGGSGRARLKIRSLFSNNGIRSSRLVANSAIVSPSAIIGDGSQILNGAIVCAGASIGRECIVNNGAQIDHESSISDGVHIAPGAVLCGCVAVGKYAFIGAGSVILPRVQIGESAIVGAGAVVTKDIPANAVVMGNTSR